MNEKYIGLDENLIKMTNKFNSIVSLNEQNNLRTYNISSRRKQRKDLAKTEKRLKRLLVVIKKQSKKEINENRMDS